MNFKSTRMWPVLLDMTKEESMQCLRNLELEAYAHLVSALRAQGPLNPDKRKLLKDTSLVLNITQDRHKAEIRRAINDERLNTIAYHVSGLNESIEDWAQEGRRTVPLIPRLAPQTVYSAIADDVADCANQNNKQLPPPALTERKRVCTSPQILPETTTNINSNNNNNNSNNNSVNNSSKTFRITDLTTKVDESNRKRKLSSSSSLSPSPSSTIVNTESSLAQHLLHGPAMKMNRNEQIYRHRTKQMLKEQSKLRKYSINGPKLQNNEETIEQIQNEINNYNTQQQQQQSHNNDNQVQQQQRSKLINPIKATNLIFKPIINPVAISTNPGPSFNNNIDNQQQQQEICSNLTTTVVVTTATTTITTTLPKRPSPLPQKLIVVSNPQTLQQTNSNILQKSVSLPLVKNLTMKNLEKFKIVTTTNQQQLNSNVVTNLNSLKHKVVTVKTNPMKKVIPLSQLLNSKGGIKVLPIGGKIIGKALTTPTTILSSSSTTTTTTNPVYIVNTVKTNIQEIDTTATTTTTTTTTNNNNNNNNSDKENGKSTVLGEILKASGVTNEDFDAQIEEFHIPNNNRVNNNNNNKEIIKSEVEGNVDNKQREIDAENQTIIEEQIIVKEKSDLIVVHENTEIIEETPEITTSQDNMEIITTNSDDLIQLQ